jgi:DNA-binding NtrC family response regulator
MRPSTTSPTILIVDDDEAVTASIGLLVRQAGYRSALASSPDEALERLDAGGIDLVLQDMNFSRATTGEEGLALLAGIRERVPEMPVILITAWGSIELAVAGMRAGAADFVTKPWGNEQLVQTIRTVLGLAASRRAPDEAPVLTRSDLDERLDLTGVVGENRKFLEVLDLVARVSHTDASVLITGENGTGKEVIAEAIHRNSPRRDRPFVKVNLGGIASTLFESEMFGHVRGAFTDAHRDRAGRFTVADGGTILLDEIGDLDLRSQVKMLRVLQDRTYEALGSSTTRTLDVRVVTATNRNLPEMVEEGSFREDLFYRINLITMHVPSLAERRDDIPRLARHFLEGVAREQGPAGATVGADALSWLETQDWPGNVRQLKHLIERTVLIHGGAELTVEQFRRTRDMDHEEGSREVLPPVGSMTVGEMERSMIVKSLEHHGGNLSKVAESLGLSRAALYRRLQKYGIET